MRVRSWREVEGRKVQWGGSVVGRVRIHDIGRRVGHGAECLILDGNMLRWRILVFVCLCWLRREDVEI